MSDFGIPINGADQLTPTDDAGTVAIPKEWFLASCSAAGNVVVILASGDEVTFYCQPGLTHLRYAVIRVKSTGTTATGNYYNLKTR